VLPRPLASVIGFACLACLYLAAVGGDTVRTTHARRDAAAVARVRGASPIVRTTRTGPHPFAVAVDARAGRVFVLTSGTIAVGVTVEPRGPFGVNVLDARTGAALETLPLGGTGLALDSRTGRVFILAVGPTDILGVGRRPGRVSVLDARTGRLIRRVSVGRGPRAAAVDERTGRVFVVNRDDGTVSVLDAATGAVLRTTGVDPSPRAVAVDERTRRVYVACSAFQGGSVAALDAATGATEPINAVLPRPVGSVAVDEQADRVIASDPNTRGSESPGTPETYIIDGATGVVARTVEIPGTLVATDGHTGRAFIVYVPDPYNAATEGSVVQTLATRGGQLLQTVPVAASPLTFLYGAAIAVAVRAGRVIVANPDTDNVSVLDARSGRVVRHIGVGHAPQTVAVDEQTARIFVANAGDNTVSMLDAARL